MSTAIETERKFLIEFPIINAISSNDLCVIKSIEQTYLISEKGCSRRVRKITSNGIQTFIYTKKTRISEISCIEEEYEISEDEYLAMMEQKNPVLNTIFKTRYSFPCKKHIMEVDIYPFWNDRAILEIELETENEKYEIPEIFHIIKDVSDDKRYKNISLAYNIINEKL